MLRTRVTPHFGATLYPPCGWRHVIPSPWISLMVTTMASLIDRRRLDTARRRGWSHGANDRSRQPRMQCGGVGHRGTNERYDEREPRRRRLTHIDQWQLNQSPVDPPSRGRHVSRSRSVFNVTWSTYHDVATLYKTTWPTHKQLRLYVHWPTRQRHVYIHVRMRRRFVGFPWCIDAVGSTAWQLRGWKHPGWRQTRTIATKMLLRLLRDPIVSTNIRFMRIFEGDSLERGRQMRVDARNRIKLLMKRPQIVYD